MAIIEIFNGIAINCVMLQASPFWMVGGGGGVVMAVHCYPENCVKGKKLRQVFLYSECVWSLVINCTDWCNCCSG